MSVLLDPLTEDQQRLVDEIAMAFIESENEWPLFGYLEALFDRDRKDAWEVLASLPRVGRWQYGAAWWVGMNVPNRPPADVEIELTILGLSHSDGTRGWVPSFLRLLQLIVDLRLSAPLNPRKVDAPVFTSGDLISGPGGRDRMFEDGAKRLGKVMLREPVFVGGSVARQPDGSWSVPAARPVLQYEGVETLADYVDAIERVTAMPQNENTPFTAGELAQIAAGARELVENLRKDGIDPAQVALIESKLDYLVDAARRMPRLDWRNAFLGAFVSLFVDAIVPPEVVSHALDALPPALAVFVGVGVIGRGLRALRPGTERVADPELEVEEAADGGDPYGPRV